MQNKYTIQDLESARSALADWRHSQCEEKANNPNKYEGNIRFYQDEVERIERALKVSGLIPMSDHEKLESELDRLFPRARSREIVEFEDQKYQRRFFPARRSRSRKTVVKWHKWWEPVNMPELP